MLRTRYTGHLLYWVGYVSVPPIRRWTFRRRTFRAGKIWCQNFFFQIRFSVATLFRFVARFARVRIDDSSFNRFALNGIQRYFFGGIFPGRFLSGGFYPVTVDGISGIYRVSQGKSFFHRDIEDNGNEIFSVWIERIYC